ncbi:MAG: hypothetical protein LV468_04665, partial [Candidatus Nitrosotenuis sp.]|nr:hypothetical protein [Candidatus Nitrosotenuis sp.]
MAELNIWHRNKTESVPFLLYRVTLKRIHPIIFCLCLAIIGFSLSSQKIQTDQTLELLLDKSSKHVGVDMPRS